MTRLFFALGAVFGGLGVIAGAFGAHVLERRLPTDLMHAYEVAARYQIYHALALMAAAYALERWASPAALWAGWLFAAGILVFSGSLYVLALTGQRWWGMVTPVGGLAQIFGWACLAWAAWRAPSRESRGGLS
jgi:uncharacterized membrane protein YgdD (TMEM256/DUF423 family)